MTTSRLHRPTLLLLLAMAGGSLLAQAPSGYYDPAAGKTGTELRQALHDIIDNHTTISYANIWNAFWSTDNKGNGVVWDMYSDIPNGTPHYVYHMVTDQCGSPSREGDCYNREHSWPKSWFSGGESGVPGRDLHHIFPTDGFVNAQRSNNPFGEVQNASWTSRNGSKLGSCKSSLGYSGTVFEPIDEYKGDFARAYFYMSTRYYGEDSDWGSSGMTNKAEIKDWAMAMLLRWSDQDPVSQKEIDRNNAIYNQYQHNRNPFIDHPEYARMIWDENYQGGATYSIACASGIQHGTISAPTSAVEGSLVNLYATPDAGYMLGSWNVYKTTAPNTTVAVTNNSFVMPSYNVTVSATFVVNNTNYIITCVQNLSHGSISASPTSARSGTTVTLSNTPATGYSLYSYYVYKTGDINTIVYSGSGNTFTMPAFDVTVSASFAQGTGGNGDYVKTSAQSDWSGEYLIVYEDDNNDNKAFNGGLTVLDVTGNTISVTISNNTIASTTTTNAAKFTIEAMRGGYSIRAASGKYIGFANNDNGLTSSNTALVNTVTYNNTCVDIKGSGGAYLRFNSQSDQNRFRYFKSGTYTNQQPIQLYKKTGGSVTAPTHTIQFNPNGGSGSGYTQTVNEFEPTALDANTFTRSGYAFYGWNTAANGSGTFYADGATVTLLNDLTLYAQWTPTYTITCQSVEHGTIVTNVNEAAEGDLVSLTATPDAGYDLDYWMVTDANGELVDVANNAFVMPGCDVTVSAVFAAYVDAYAQEYFLVTSVDQLIADRTYLIVNVDAGKALSTTQNTNNRAATAVSIDQLDGWYRIATIANTSACELILERSTNETWALKDPSFDNGQGGYLYAASSSNNQLKTQPNVDDNARWTIEIGDNGIATIVAQGSNTRNIMRYNPSSNFFSCYTSNSQNVSVVYLFIKGEEFEHTQSETIAQLLPSDKHTVHSGATLTVSATATSGSPSHIILEEGAQLVHNSDGVKATLKKTVNGYTGDGGWYTIATPFVSLNPSEVGGMTDGSYDLYSYDEDGDANGKEWVNYKPNGSFGMASGLGYLYANGNSRTLRMGGTLNSGNYSQQVELSYNNGSDNIKGFNLLGNPTAHDISFAKSNNVSDGYYYLNHDGTWVYQTGSSVPVGRGFLVKANATGQTVTLNPQSRGERPEEGQYLCLSVGDEKAYVKLDEGVSMPLIDIRGRRLSLYLLSERKPYAMLVRDGADALDLCFEPRQNGVYTLTVDTQGLGLDYLHLVDNMTGADVDLLSVGNRGSVPAMATEGVSYTFTAKTTDYASRFRLVFSEPADGPSATDQPFAYYADGEIRVVADAHDAFLQVVDVMGRVVRTVGLSQCGSRTTTTGMTPGMYVLRLISDKGVRQQKIVVD